MYGHENTGVALLYAGAYALELTLEGCFCLQTAHVDDSTTVLVILPDAQFWMVLNLFVVEVPEEDLADHL